MAIETVKEERKTGLARQARRGPRRILPRRQEVPRPPGDTARFRKRKPSQATRELGDLISIGPAMLRDFEQLGIRSMAQLARQNPRRLYEKLVRVAGQHQDICVLDVFSAAVEQAQNPRLPAEKCQWWWWSQKRKQAKR
jgi:nucleotidyltransferase/DNA polymerase involved in DNA repair